MKQKPLPRIHVPLRRRLSRLVRGPLPLLVWLVAVAAYVLLTRAAAPPVELKGSLEPRRFDVTAPLAGRIDSLCVTPYQRVIEGQFLGMVDDADLLARTARVRAEIVVIEAEQEHERLVRAEAQQALLLDEQVETRRFFEERARLELEALRTRADLEPLEIRRTRLVAERDRLLALVAKDAASRRELADQELLVQELDREIAGRHALLEVYAAELGESEHRLKAFGAGDRSPRPEFYGVFRARLDERRDELDHIAADRERLAIRAPRSGLVTAVMTHAGQSVSFGSTLLSVESDEGGELVLFLPPEHDLGQVRATTRLLLRAPRDPGLEVAVVVGAVSPRIEELPRRLWLDDRRPEFGRPIKIETPEPSPFLMGERVDGRIVVTESVAGTR